MSDPITGQMRQDRYESERVIWRLWFETWMRERELPGSPVTSAETPVSADTVPNDLEEAS